MWGSLDSRWVFPFPRRNVTGILIQVESRHFGQLSHFRIEVSCPRTRASVRARLWSRPWGPPSARPPPFRRSATRDHGTRFLDGECRETPGICQSCVLRHRAQTWGLRRGTVTVPSSPGRMPFLSLVPACSRGKVPRGAGAGSAGVSCRVSPAGRALWGPPRRPLSWCRPPALAWSWAAAPEGPGSAAAASSIHYPGGWRCSRAPGMERGPCRRALRGSP